MELSDKTAFTFLVSNPGLFRLDIQYELCGPPELQRHLQVKPEYAAVAAGKQGCCTVSFYPQEKCVLRDVSFNIKVWLKQTHFASYLVMSYCHHFPTINQGALVLSRVIRFYHLEKRKTVFF